MVEPLPKQSSSHFQRDTSVNNLASDCSKQPMLRFLAHTVTAQKASGWETMTIWSCNAPCGCTHRGHRLDCYVDILLLTVTQELLCATSPRIFLAMSTHNSVASSNRRRDSQQSWTGSEIFRSQSPNDVVVQNNSQVKLSGKAWGRIKKFLLCKTDFPSSIYYIVGNEFCERFSYYGMKAILILYLTRVLMLGDDTATAVFHSFSMLCYFTPLFGAMLADGWLGKYRWEWENFTIQKFFSLIPSL